MHPINAYADLRWEVHDMVTERELMVQIIIKRHARKRAEVR